MTVSAADVLKGYYNAAKALGDKAVSSDAYFEIEGHEGIALLTKQFPWPVLSPGGEIEIATAMGAAMWQPQQLKVHQQGQLAFVETRTGMIQKFMNEVNANGARFDAIVYEGTPDKFTRAVKIKDCFFQADNPDRDWENRSQVVMINGTLFFHFFGETIPGNVVI